MTKKDYINNISDISVDDIITGIKKGIVSFEELQATGGFKRPKQAEVRTKLKKIEEEDDAYKNAKAKNSIVQYNDFMNKYSNSEYNKEIKSLIQQKEEQERINKEEQIAKIKDNTNDYTIEDARKILGDDLFNQVCSDLDLDYEQVINYQPTQLRFNMIPESQDEVPKDYTDVFFWGIPSSGKTTALSTIFRTINDKYTMEDPVLKKQFGSTYRDDLVSVYKQGLGYLPGRNQRDKTQYMPLLLRRKNEGIKKNRRISFFELSGEVFEHFLEIKNGLKDKSQLNENELEKRIEIEKSFNTIELLLNSNNQKIHFFFIDYDKEIKNLQNHNTKSQASYLTAAADYFKSRNDIFSKKTDGVYFIITKADTIEGESKTKEAEKFINENFSNFYGIIEGRCKAYSIKPPEIKLFSIGDVYFNRICKIEYKYAENIIGELLNTVKPTNNSWLRSILKK